MTIHLHRKPDLEFDGFLRESSDSPGQLCDCRIWLAKDAAEDTWIEISVPADVAVCVSRPGPMTLTGTIGEKREVLISGLWVDRAPAGSFPQRRAGQRLLDLGHVDRITERYSFEGTHAGDGSHPDYAMSFELTDCKYLSPAKVIQTSYTGDVTVRTPRRIEVMYPRLGRLVFERHYRHYQRHDVVGAIHTSSLIAEVLEPGRELIADVDRSRSQIDDICLLASLAARQRVMVLGSHYVAPHEICSSWITPLKRHRPPARSEGRQRLIELADFADYFATSASKFCAMSDRDQERVREAIYPLAPAFELGSVETEFLSMFSAIEALIRIEQPDIEGGPSIVDMDRWKTVKREVKKTVNSLGAEFSDGEKDAIRQKIGELNRPSIRASLTGFFSRYAILTEDLWPVFGSSEMPGLAEIRNRLAHGHIPSATVLGALGMAQFHLTLLLERCLLSVLGYPVERSRAGTAGARLEAETGKQQVKQLQQMLGRKPDSDVAADAANTQ